MSGDVLMPDIDIVRHPLGADVPLPGRVSSETPLRTPQVRVVEIALGAGAELTEHSAPAPIIVQVLEGAVEFHVGGATHLLEAPGFVHLPDAGERHRVLASDPARIQITMLLDSVPRNNT